MAGTLQGQPTAESGPLQRPPGAGRPLVLGLLCLAQLMITLDSTIVSVALPSIQTSVGLSDAGRGWAVTAYTLAFGGLLLLGGRLGDLLGRKRTMLAGVAGFALASALGGAAQNAEMLISARALQGAFAALIAPATLALITATFVEQRERARALSVYTAAMMSGGGLGLILGGVLTTYAGWRWCMFVNVPIGIAVVIGCLRSVPNPKPETNVSVDAPGALLGTLSMVSLIYALAEAGSGGWGSASVIATFAAAAVLLAGFVYRQARASGPLLPLRVLRNRNSCAGFFTFLISAFCTYGMLLSMTYQLQRVMHYSPLKTGFAFLAYVGTAVIFSTQVANRLVRRIRPGIMIAAGLLVFTGALLLLTRLTPTSTYGPDVLPALLMFGIGVGTITVPAITTVVTVNEARDAGAVSALVSTVQQMGASVGVALLNTVSVSGAAAFLAAHPGGAQAVMRASVHGLALSSRLSAGIAVAGAVIAIFAIRVNLKAKQQQQTAAAAAQQAPAAATTESAAEG